MYIVDTETFSVFVVYIIVVGSGVFIVKWNMIIMVSLDSSLKVTTTHLKYFIFKDRLNFAEIEEFSLKLFEQIRF